MENTTVEFTGFLGWLTPYLVELVAIVIAGAVAWATKKFHDLTGITIEAKHREALQSALNNGAKLIIDRIPATGTIDVKSPAMATAINYVIKSVPDAVAFFGLTPERIGELLKPKLMVPPAVLVETT
jgi:hypothetical protein